MLYIFLFILLLLVGNNEPLLLFSWSPVREVFPYHDVVMFQPHIGTSPELGSVANFYIYMFLSPAPLFIPATQCPPVEDNRS